MNTFFKTVVQNTLQRFGKRITNYHAPAKPYEAGMTFLKSFIEPPTLIIDIGIGDGTPDLTASFPFGEYKYLLIEADERFLPYIEGVKNKHPDTVTFEHCFCGDTNGTVTFNLKADGKTSSRYADNGTISQTQVPMVTLDSLAKKHGVTGPILLKVDVEGSELDVLKGATATLPHCNVVILESWVNQPVGVQSPSTLAALIQFMHEHSFALFDLFGGHNYKTGVLKMVDLVFVKHDSPYRLNQKLK